MTFLCLVPLRDDSLTTISSTPEERKNEVSQQKNKERNISQAPKHSHARSNKTAHIELKVTEKPNKNKEKESENKKSLLE
jgi:hypothetical protein